MLILILIFSNKKFNRNRSMKYINIFNIFFVTFFGFDAKDLRPDSTLVNKFAGNKMGLMLEIHTVLVTRS